MKRNESTFCTICQIDKLQRGAELRCPHRHAIFKRGADGRLQIRFFEGVHQPIGYFNSSDGEFKFK